MNTLNPGIEAYSEGILKVISFKTDDNVKATLAFDGTNFLVNKPIKVQTGAAADDIVIDNSLKTDTINEATSAAGVTIEGVLIKDSLIVTPTISGALSTDTISEKTADTGVTIDGTKLKDGLITTAGTAGGGTIKAHAHDCTNGYANEFKGEFLNSSDTMDGIISVFIWPQPRILELECYVL
jgi:hypothetical protein